jgi:hypothetical protein
VEGVHFDSYTEARTRLKDLLDATERGRTTTIRRESATAAVVDADRSRRFLAALSPVRAQVVARPEAGRYLFRVFPSPLMGPHSMRPLAR